MHPGLDSNHRYSLRVRRIDGESKVSRNDTASYKLDLLRRPTDHHPGLRLSGLLQEPSFLIHHVVLQMPQLELRGQRDQRFAVAEEEVAGLGEAVVEIWDHHPPRKALETNDGVSAGDDLA